MSESGKGCSIETMIKSAQSFSEIKVLFTLIRSDVSMVRKRPFVTKKSVVGE